jgi:hypothetical protein
MAFEHRYVRLFFPFSSLYHWCPEAPNANMDKKGKEMSWKGRERKEGKGKEKRK